MHAKSQTSAIARAYLQCIQTPSGSPPAFGHGELSYLSYPSPERSSPNIFLTQTPNPAPPVHIFPIPLLHFPIHILPPSNPLISSRSIAHAPSLPQLFPCHHTPTPDPIVKLALEAVPSQLSSIYARLASSTRNLRPEGSTIALVRRRLVPCCRLQKV